MCLLKSVFGLWPCRPTSENEKRKFGMQCRLRVSSAVHCRQNILYALQKNAGKIICATIYIQEHRSGFPKLGAVPNLVHWSNPLYFRFLNSNEMKSTERCVHTNLSLRAAQAGDLLRSLCEKDVLFCIARSVFYKGHSSMPTVMILRIRNQKTFSPLFQKRNRFSMELLRLSKNSCGQSAGSASYSIHPLETQVALFGLSKEIIFS